MTKHLLLLLSGLFILNLSYAQDKLSGRVIENKTNVALGGIKIENLKNHNGSVSDSTGRFSIKANIGDYIAFSGFAYHGDTVYVTNLKYLEVHLDLKQNVLNEVRVITPE